MRITDNMLLANYNTNLQRNISNLAASNMRLASERSFNHVSEDTSAAARAFVIRDQLAKTEEHIRTIDNAAGELSSAEGNIMVIQSIATSAYETATSAGGPKEQKDFEILAEQINGQKNEMLQTMNATYANKFIGIGCIHSLEHFILLSVDLLCQNFKILLFLWSARTGRRLVSRSGDGLDNHNIALRR